MEVAIQTGFPGRVLTLDLPKVGRHSTAAGAAISTIIELSKGKLVASLELYEHSILVRTLSEEEGLYEFGLGLELAVRRIILPHIHAAEERI